jgi:WYL domain
VRDQLTTAIEQRKIVTFTYEGLARRVQPAAFGVGNRKGKETLHGYQVGGESKRGGVPHWRNFHVDKITGLAVLDEVFGPNPPGFNPTPFPQTQVALAGGSAAGSASSGGQQGDAKKSDQVIPGVPISEDQAAKAAEVAGEVASKAFNALGKWFKKR